ncbi:MAG: hypothetical protein HRK26_00060 [Rickettsiaceae bacterium H1]|nr:hypothetical protein [Rickettsiaceae bacterium H1]
MESFEWNKKEFLEKIASLDDHNNEYYGNKTKPDFSDFLNRANELEGLIRSIMSETRHIIQENSQSILF